jgi:transcriptional regulator with XRE-family HTH domain
VSNFHSIREHGRGLKAVREFSGISAKDLATRLGVAASYVSEVETGKRPLTEAFAGKICTELGYQPREFVEHVIAGDPETASVLREDPVPYGSARHTPQMLPPPNPPSASCAEMEILARWFYLRLTPEARASYLAELSSKALAGDSEAASAARALLLLIRSNPEPAS